MTQTDASLFERVLIAYARRFPIDRGKLRMIDALWPVAAGSRGTHRVATLDHGRFRMPCDISEMLQRQFYFFGTYFLESRILACWQEAARHSAMVFDVGANAGIFSLAARAVRPDAVVHAFEPTPEIAARLRETVALNELAGIHIHQTAVAARDGQATLIRWRGEFNSNEGMNFIKTRGEPGAERVATVSLDSFCAARGIDRIDLLKLDIQGQEPLALAGAARLLHEGRIGTIFTELSWSGAPGLVCPATEAIATLVTCGYEFSEPQLPLRWKKAGDWMRPLGDIVARRAVSAAGSHP